MSFDYSTKNIPLPKASQYRKRLIEKTEQLIRRMRWHTYSFLNPDINANRKNTYGFNSQRKTPYMHKLREFENHVPNITKKVEFSESKCDLQQLLRTDIKHKLHDESHTMVSADKTNKYYKIGEHGKILLENATKSYVKADRSTV